MTEFILTELFRRSVKNYFLVFLFSKTKRNTDNYNSNAIYNQ